MEGIERMIFKVEESYLKEQLFRFGLNRSKVKKKGHC